jgi:hypothetical protein
VKRLFEEGTLEDGLEGVSGSAQAIFGAIARLSAQWIQRRPAVRKAADGPDADTGRTPGAGMGRRP